MSNDNKPPRSETQVGHPAAPERPKRKADKQGFADTLPTSEPPRMQHPGPNTTDDLVSSAPVRAVAGHAQASGYVTLSGERIAESLARELIARRMSKDGISMREDYAFSHGDLLVNLDAFDTESKVGFQYISHADADVVTDVDTEVESRLRELSEQGVAHVLIIHDHEARTADVVLEKVEEFLSALKKRSS